MAKRKQRRCDDHQSLASLEKANRDGLTPTEQHGHHRGDQKPVPLQQAPPVRASSSCAAHHVHVWVCRQERRDCNNGSRADEESRRAPCHMQPTQLRDEAALLRSEGCGRRGLEGRGDPSPTPGSRRVVICMRHCGRNDKFWLLYYIWLVESREASDSAVKGK